VQSVGNGFNQTLQPLKSYIMRRGQRRSRLALG
jgi:hypothetical protein